MGDLITDDVSEQTSKDGTYGCIADTIIWIGDQGFRFLIVW